PSCVGCRRRLLDQGLVHRRIHRRGAGGAAHCVAVVLRLHGGRCGMSATARNLRDPLKRVRGHGSAKNGTQHFILQRISAVILAILTPWLLWLLISLIPADYATVRAT